VRGQQYKYRGHVVHLLCNVGKIYHELPLFPRNLDILLLRPPSSARNLQHEAQFQRRFTVRRRVVETWLT
jgi:hypothetical protein